MTTKNKIIEIFCIEDDFCEEYEIEIKKHQIEADVPQKKRNKKTRISQAEMITITIGFHYGTHRNFKHYYLSNI